MGKRGVSSKKILPFPSLLLLGRGMEIIKKILKMVKCIIFNIKSNIK
jgi:hypothetical protein